MNILKVLDQLSDDKFFTQGILTSNKKQSYNFGTQKQTSTISKGSFASGSAMASKYSMLGPNDALTDALQLALILEYLEDEYYAMGLAASSLIPSEDRVVFQQISQHEAAHVTFLRNTLISLGQTPGAKPEFDFTVGGNFDPMGDYQQFLILAQAFEDTGVRAYKGQAGNVASNGTVLQAALQIHSVEARHASQVRRMRANKGWIELGNGGNMPAATDPVYNGEGNTMQAGFNTADAFGAAAGSAAYDEILTGSEATAIASLFIV